MTAPSAPTSLEAGSASPTETIDIVLWLDLEESNQLENAALREHLPAGAIILRATEHGASQSAGQPWRRVLDLIDRMVRSARQREKQAAACHYWVTGRARLPAFFHLGHRLSKFAAVTFVHQPWTGEAIEKISLAAARAAVAAPYFTRKPWPPAHSAAAAPVALVISSKHEPDVQLIEDAMAKQGTRLGAVFRAHAEAALDARTAGTAIRELEETVRLVCQAHPRRATLALCIAGPTSLAFLVGMTINPRAYRDVQILEYDGSTYAVAYALPYPPLPARNKLVLLQASPTDQRGLALGKELRTIALEQGAGQLTDRLEIVAIPAAQPMDLVNALRQHEPGIVHFSGHGETGALSFENDARDSQRITTADLAEALRHFGDSVRLVVLSACHSTTHHEIAALVDCVVAMEGPVGDDDAIHFASALYRHLAEGDSVRAAFNKAELVMRLTRTSLAAPTRDIDDVGSIHGKRREPPTILEIDAGYADTLRLVRRQ